MGARVAQTALKRATWQKLSRTRVRTRAGENFCGLPVFGQPAQDVKKELTLIPNTKKVVAYTQVQLPNCPGLASHDVIAWDADGDALIVDPDRAQKLVKARNLSGFVRLQVLDDE